MPSNWNISETDRPVLQHAIGAASLDKVRGFKTSLVAAYKAKGGKDATSETVLASYDKGFAKVDLSAATNALAANRDIHQTYHSWNMSSLEQTTVQRAIGEAVLSKLEGLPKGMVDCYRALGGNNPESLSALQKVEVLFAKGNPAQLAS